MTILIYIFFMLGMVLLSIKLSNGDYFDVSLIFLAGYLISAICCLYNITIWNVDIHIITIVILIIGIFSFNIGCYFGKRIRKKKTKDKASGDNLLQYIQRGEASWKLCLAVIFDICLIILLYRDIVQIASVNMVSWGNLFYNFRANLGNDTLNVGYSPLVNLGLRITKPLAYIYSAIFAECIINPNNRKPFIRKLPYIFPVLLYAFQVILQGYRIQLIAVIVALLFDFFFFLQIRSNWKAKINFKVALKICFLFVLVCIGFYYVKFFIGKQQESNGVVAYITNYLGGSLQLFDMYLQEPLQKGYETFAAMVDSLKKYGLFEKVQTVVQHEHRRASTGVYIGNVYTGFRNYYNDYGLMGLCFFSWLLGFIFSKWYVNLKVTKEWSFKSVFSLLVYSYLLYTIVFYFFTDYFFSLIGVGWFVNIFIFYLISFCIFRIQIGRKKHS